MRNEFWLLHGKKVLTIGVIISLIGAWIFGGLTLSTDVEEYLPDAIPEATSFELITSQTSDNLYLYAATAGTSQIGYVTTGEGQGYGGPMLVMVAWSDDGVILNVLVPENKETEAFYVRLADQEYFSQYIGRGFSDPFTLGEDIDGASGATRSARGVA